MTIEALTEQEFLARRGDRMLQLGYGGSCPTGSVGLVVHPDALRSETALPAVAAAANLLARWAPALTVSLPAVSDIRIGSVTTAVEAAVRTANPFLNIRWADPPASSPSLTIGPVPPACPNGVTAWADGWVAISSRGSACAYRSKPITSVLLFAVALGVGRVFRDAWRLPTEARTELRWDTWRHCLEAEPSGGETSPLPAGPPNLGRVLQVGAGAVGSNIIYFLGLMGAAADLVVLDHDVVKIENLDRSLLFGLQDAHPQETPKVEAVLRAVEHFPHLRVHPVPAKWAEYAATSYRVGAFDLALALANEDHVWPAMAEAVLPLTLQATTDGAWGVAYGAHTPGTGYCLRCRFPPDVTATPTICAEGAVEIEPPGSDRQTVHASLPFQSAAAAGLLSIEIDKLALGPVPGAANFVAAKIDVTENVVTARQARSTVCPACRSFPEDYWMAKYGKTRFACHRS